MHYKWVELGSKIIGYLNAITSGLLFLLLFICSFLVPKFTDLILDKLIEFSRIEAYQRRDMRLKVEPALWKIIISGICVSIITLFFSVLLLNGIYKRKPGHVLSCFVFGVIVNTIHVITYITLGIKHYADIYFGLIQSVVYSAMLCIIWLTYKKIKLEKSTTLLVPRKKLESEI